MSQCKVSEIDFDYGKFSPSGRIGYGHLPRGTSMTPASVTMSGYSTRLVIWTAMRTTVTESPRLVSSSKNLKIPRRTVIL